MNIKIKNWAIFSLLIIAIIIVVPSVCYFRAFTEKSSNTSDWSNYATYLNVCIASCNLISFIFLSILIYNYNLRRDSANEKFQLNLSKPILTFETDSDNSTGKEIWSMKNIGNGPALNIKVAEMNEDNWIGNKVVAYHLGKNESKKLIWLTSAGLICAMYKDLFDNEYLSVAINDTTTIFDIKNKSISKNDIISQEYFQSFLELSTERLHLARKKSSATSTTSSSTSGSQTTTQNSIGDI